MEFHQLIKSLIGVFYGKPLYRSILSPTISEKRMNQPICDVCGKATDTKKLVISPAWDLKSSQNYTIDVCYTCAEKVKTFIKLLKPQWKPKPKTEES